MKVYWYDGGKKPGMPSEAFTRDKLFKGVLFNGDKGYLLCDYDYRILMPTGGNDMTQYASPKAKDLIPPSIGHHAEWIKACKTDKQTLCNFDYSGALIENNLLALVAYRVGKKLDWDAENLKATNCPEADKYIRKTVPRRLDPQRLVTAAIRFGIVRSETTMSEREILMADRRLPSEGGLRKPARPE